jgi:hypothetical protein
MKSILKTLKNGTSLPIVWLASGRSHEKTNALSNKPRVAALLFVGACSVLSACTGDPVGPVGPVTDGAALVITNKTPTLIEGTFADATTPVSFRSVERAPRSVDVTIRVGETELAIRIDHALGEAAFNANSGQLSPAQISTIERLMAAFVEAFANEDTAPSNAEVALRHALNYAAAAPPSTRLPTFTAVSENGWVYLPCSCSWNYIGSGWYAQTGKGETCGSSGSPHCPGRCGVGCGPDNLKWPWSWGSGVYTQDCALHDYGLGSWENALDDYTLAPYNCG